MTGRRIAELNFRFRAALVIVFLWGLSLIMPALAIRFDADVRILVGYQVLTSGWIGVAYLQLGWLANPLLVTMLAGWASGRMRPRSVRWLAWALVGASLSTVDLPLRAAFHRHVGFGAGYWLWMMNNLGAAALVLATTRRWEGAQ